jgi:VWFA-related protein
VITAALYQFAPSQFWVQRLGWALLHFFWQGTAIAIVYTLLRSRLAAHSLSARGRYALACAALAAMGMAPLLTFLLLPGADARSVTVVSPQVALWTFSPAESRRLLTGVVSLWVVGVGAFSIRLFGGWRFTARLRSTAHPAPAEWQRTLEQIAARLGGVVLSEATQPVRLLISAMVDVPTVIGWLRPVILVPIEFLGGLPEGYITALLAHEMAHIRRYDYLASMLQSLIEAVLFYHPAVWWISEQIRAERELCCDDLAVAASGDVITYARALAELESRQPSRKPVLAANGGSLVNRIGRLIEPARANANTLPGPAAAWAMILLWLAGVGVATVHAGPHSGPMPVPSPPVGSPNPTTARSATAPSSPLAALGGALGGALGNNARKTVLFDPFFAAQQAQPQSPGVKGSDTPEPRDTSSLFAKLQPPPELTFEDLQAAIGPITTDDPPRLQASPQQQPAPRKEPETGAVFRSGTRLVEVEVVVREKKSPGPVPLFAGTIFGSPGPVVQSLRKEDFTFLDEGQVQPIAVFHAGPSSIDSNPMVIPPGAVSNRTDSRGRPLNGVTVVLIDQLNTHFDLKGYEHLGVTKLLRSLTAADRVALYTLGRDLQVMQDFTDDPHKLIDAVAKLDQGLIPVDPATIVRDGDDSIGWADWAEDRGKTTAQAMKRIVQHLSGVPGRKNLVWFEDEPVPAEVAAMLRQANIAVYPVLVRAVGAGLVTKSAGGHIGQELAREHAAQNLAALTGGRAFFDAMDLPAALQTAEEDSRSSYVLGYYPNEEMLDGKYHNITVLLKTGSVKNDAFEVSYRAGYLATKLPTKDEFFDNPLDLAGVGLAAQLRPDPTRPGRRQLHVTVDLHDVQLESKDGRLSGAFQLALIFIPSKPGPSQSAPSQSAPSQSTKAMTVRVNFGADRLQKALKDGYAVNVGGLDAQSGEIRVVVQDVASGVAGSVRLPLGGK